MCVFVCVCTHVCMLCMLVCACINTGLCSRFVCVHVLSVYVQACHISVLCVYGGTCASVCNTCCVGMQDTVGA